MVKRQLKLLLCATLLLAGAITAFSQEKGEKLLKQDGNFVVGKLENGLTYYIRKNDNPKKSAEFFIAHNVGSLQEEENQRGLAHFLEHMAFNGTKNFPGKNMLNSLAGIGVKFGANVNAYTSMDRTVYNISEVPVIRESIIDSVLLMIHDWSYYISCKPEEIEAERGVIREEWRRGDDARTRMLRHFSTIEQKGSRFADRSPIGLPQVINTFKPQTLIDYYHKWYRPDLQAVFVVGDISPKEIEAKIKQIFSSIPKAKNPAERLTYKIPDNKEPIVDIFTDPELKASSVRIIVKFPALSVEEKLKESSIKDKLLAELFYDMVTDRINKNVKNKKSPLYKTAVPSIGEIYYASRVFRITAIQNKDEYEKSLIGILTDYETIRKYGFGKEEFDNAIISKRAKIKKDANKNSNIKSVDYVNAAVETFTRGDVLVDIKEMCGLQSKLLSEITLDDINTFVSKNFKDKNLAVIFAGAEKDAPKFSSQKRALFIIDSIRKAELTPYEYIPDNTLNFSAKLSPITVGAAQNYSIVPGAKQITLPNGNRLIWIENSNSGVSVSFRAVKNGGFATETDENIYTARLMKAYLSNYIINGMDKNNYSRFKNNSALGLSVDITSRHDIWSGFFNKDNPEPFFKILYLSMTDVTVDKHGFNAYKQNIINQLSKKASPMSIFKDSCSVVSFEQSCMNKKFTAEAISSITTQGMSDTYNRHFASATGLTYIFEGDISLESIKPYIEKYLANLPHKVTDTTQQPALRDNIWKKGELSLRYKAGSQVSTKASIQAIIRGDADYNTHNHICSRYLTYILRDRYTKSIREERGGTYTIGVKEDFQLYPQPSLSINIDFDTDPKLIDELVDCVWVEFKNLAKDGPLESEVEKIKLYLNKNLNSKILEDKRYMGQAIADVVGEPYIQSDNAEIINSISAKDIKKFVKRIVKQKNYSTFVIEP